MIKLISWYCFYFYKVDITGCLDVIFNALLILEKDILKEIGICVSVRVDIDVVDLLKIVFDLKECFMFVSNVSNLLNLSSRIEDFVLGGVLVNIIYDGWLFFYIVFVIGDVKFVSWFLENGTNNKF